MASPLWKNKSGGCVHRLAPQPPNLPPWDAIMPMHTTTAMIFSSNIEVFINLGIQVLEVSHKTENLYTVSFAGYMKTKSVVLEFDF